MKKLMLSILLVSASSLANAKIDSLKVSCKNLQSVVSTEGSVLIGTGPYIYDVFVEHAGYCAPGQTTEPAWIEAKDTNQCFVGYTCKQKDSQGSNP